jgi:hypothetical protein
VSSTSRSLKWSLSLQVFPAELYARFSSLLYIFTRFTNPPLFGNLHIIWLRVQIVMLLNILSRVSD